MGLGCLPERPALARPTAYRPAYHRPGPLGTLVTPTRNDITRYLRIKLDEDEMPDVMDESLEEDILENIPENVSEMYVEQWC